ncbi:hypothetical protein CNR22_05645 [Sphingobacteriaceae bacterium]|nr:hypothetical protein CNR22_05645 [Sphingobacteriaceae bacterium]
MELHQLLKGKKSSGKWSIFVKPNFFFMRKIYLLFISLISVSVTAQDNHCATDVVMKRIYDKNPGLKISRDARFQSQRSSAQRPQPSATYIIPIVFHVLHVNGPENISDAQVKDGLRILNRDFARQNPDTTEIIPVFKNIADSTKIQFELATKDPLGNCTNGIVHHYDTDTDWDDTSPTLFSHTWDPTKYLNVYLVRTITLTGGFGASGYTYFPGTFSPGDSYDAIVVLNNYFGSIGTGSSFLSRVLTHEAGHWLDLNHVFGGSNNAGVDCSGDDFINDTPPTPGYLNCPNPAIPSQYQLCTPGVSENFQNYMDYSYCCRMFTSEQGQHMQFALQNTAGGRNNLWTNANLIATGILNPSSACIPVADFKYSRSKTCVSSPVVFKDASWNGQPTSYSWSFPGGSPAVSTASAPVVTYALPGVYSVSYTVSNTAGTSAPVTKSNIINVTSPIAVFTNYWSEGFENLSALNTNWTLQSSSGASKWEQSADAAYTGTYSAKINPANNTRKTVTSMISPAINMGTNPGPVLTFKVATAEVTTNHVNSLKVYLSVDCGNTWGAIYSKAGQSLVTSSSAASNFVPQKSEWRTETILLPQALSASYVNFKFEYTRDTIPAANTIYIDDINITGPTSIEQNRLKIQNLNVYPVPSKGALTVSFQLTEPRKITFSVCDITGRIMEEFTETQFESGEQKHIINSGGALPKGIYFLKIEIDKASSTRKIIVGE